MIFAEYLDSVVDIISKLKMEWDSRELDSKPTLVLQDITSNSVESDYQKYINESPDHYSFARSENELHVVVGLQQLNREWTCHGPIYSFTGIYLIIPGD